MRDEPSTALPQERPYDETIFSSPELIDGHRVVLHEERLQPVVQRVRARQAVITRRTVTVRKTIEVDVCHEELVVEYVAGDGSPATDEGSETIVVLLRQEEVELVKRLRVYEEIQITKRLVTEHQRLTGTVRHETLEIVG